MDNPKIRIESDGKRAEVFLGGEKIRCMLLDFHGEVAEGKVSIKWSGKKQKLGENGDPCIENHDLVIESFCCDSKEVDSE